MASRRESWRLGEQTVRVTSLDKPFWPDAGLTKEDLLRYYQEIAPVLLPYMQDRPFIMRAWPDGIEGESYYRWRVPRHAPAWLERFTYHLQSSDRVAEMAVVDEPAELIWVVNQNVPEMHPWVATRQAEGEPTLLFFDLDPVPGVSFARVLEVAGWIGEMLDELELIGLPKTSGGDGVHIFVPLARGYTFEEVRGWLGRFIDLLDERHPGAVTSDKRLAERHDRVLIDYSQNALGKSIVAPYSVRAKPGAPVSTPLSWEEVRAGKVRPLDFTLTTIRERLAEKGDLFRPLLTNAQRLPDLPERGDG